MSRTVVDYIVAHARQQPSHPALLVAGADGASTATVSYAELMDQAMAVTARLKSHGVNEGERCGLRMRQGPELIASALGILATGLCMVPIADEYEGEALERFTVGTRLHHVLTWDGVRSWPERRGVEEEAFQVLRPAYLRFTSGSAADPKGVIIGHDAILTRLEAANQGLAIGSEDRILWLLPMAHHFVVSILLYLRFGATIVLPSSTLARHVLSMAQRTRATVIYASPFHYQLLAKDTSGVPLDTVRLAVSTATGLRRETAVSFRERFRIALVQALGIIEVGLPLMNLASATGKPTAIGRPLPGFHVWLRDEGGRDVSATATAEVPAEVCIRGPGMFDAYLEPWALAANLLAKDGFRTGDQGWFDGDGDLYLAGRRDNRISMAGMKFFCEEVEAVLDGHPDVQQSRVTARQHAHLGEIPVAAIVPSDAAHPPTEEVLIEHCRQQLPPYKIPRQFRIVAELPMTLTGKIRRG